MEPDLSEFTDPPRQQPCKVRTILAELDVDRRAKLMAALNAKVSHVKIAKVLTGWGFPIGDNAVGTHRRKGCSCD